jgi:hypothetical protein
MKSLFTDYPQVCQAPINLFGREKIELERKNLELAYNHISTRPLIILNTVGRLDG